MQGIAGFEDVSWREGVTALPFEENAFDATRPISATGAAILPKATTRELIRVTRPGGRIGSTSWRSTSLYPSMAGVVMAVLPPEHFWQQTATSSGMFIEVLEEVDDVDFPGLREQLIETIEPYFDDHENAVELEYLLTTATVTKSEWSPLGIDPFYPTRRWHDCTRLKLTPWVGSHTD